MQRVGNITKGDEIVHRLRAGEDRSAVLALIIDCYGERLYWHLRRLLVLHEEAEDALQDMCVIVYKAIGGFRGDGEPSLLAWLYRVATSVALRALRRRRRSIFVSIDSLAKELLSDYETEVSPDADEIAIRLQRTVVGLPMKQKLVFNLRYYDDLSFEQISEITSQSVATLKVNYHYAVKKVKEQIATIEI